MSDNEVKIIMSAVDKASSVIKGVTTTTGKMNSAFQSLTGISLGAAGGIAIAGKAIGALTDFTKASINETVAYNKEIREMTQVTGLGAKEISGIVQVADDWGIEIGTVRTALQMMNKNGITPSVENLAILADEYVNATDKSKFMEMATKKYGRSVVELIPILAKGGKELREQTDAIDDNMLATEESIKASREYEVAVDDLNDAWQGLKYELGNAVIPALTDVLDSINKLKEEHEETADNVDKLTAAYKLGLISEEKFNSVQYDMSLTADDLNKIFAEASDALDKLYVSSEAAGGSERNLVRIQSDLSGATEELADETDDLAKAAEEAAKVLQDKLKVSLDDLNNLINGELGPELEDFNETQDELTQKMVETQEEIDRLIAEGYDPMSEKVLGLKGDYGELKGQYEENATAHDEATQRILFDILTQQAAVDGLTTKEVEFLTKIATSWGLIDQETAEATLRAQEAMSYVNTSGDFEGAQLIIEGQATAWSLAKDQAAQAKSEAMGYGGILDQLDGKTVNTQIINTTYERMVTLPAGWHPGDPYPAFAGGADFIVPPGYPNDSYRMNVESGEHVVVIPKDIVNRTMNVYPTFVNASGEGVMNDLMFYAKQYGMA